MSIALVPETARLVAWDIETFKISRDAPYPYPVCVSFAATDADPLLLHCNFERDRVVAYLKRLLDDPQVTLVTQNGQFDMVCMSLAFPELIPHFNAHLKAFRGFDTMIAQKYRSLAFTGNPDDVGAGLDELVKFWLGEDISASKEAGSVRTRYGEMWNTPIDQWDDDFYNYSIDDSILTLRVAEKMLADRTIQDTQRAIRHRVRGMYWVGHKTAYGMEVDRDRAAELYHSSAAKYDFDNYQLLLDRGAIKKAVEAQPYANGALDHVEDCSKPKDKSCGCPVKMKKPVPAKTAPSVIQDLIMDFSRKYSVGARLTEKGREILNEGKEPGTPDIVEWDFSKGEPPEGIKRTQVSKGREEVGIFNQQLEVDHGVRSEVLDQWVELSRVEKVVNTYMPRFLWDEGNDCQGSYSLKWAAGGRISSYDGPQPAEGWSQDLAKLEWVSRIHFASSPLKSTGRMSSRQSSLFPSLNGQNLPRDAGVRECFKAKDDHVLVAIDFAGLELCSAAWRTKEHQDKSRLHDLLVDGRDAHSFLAAQMVCFMDPESECAAAFDSRLKSWEACLARQDVFESFKKIDPDYYKLWRTYAKPVGLGVFGLMGAARIQEVAWKQYGIVLPFRLCVEARDVWRSVFPDEYAMLREFIPNNFMDSDTGKGHYTSPLGMFRDNADATAVANGFMLQTPSAEGMLEAISNVSTECWDWTLGSILSGCRVVDDVHDELVIEMPYDDQLEDRIRRAQTIMEDSMATVLEGVPIKTEAGVMLYYSKDAYEARDESGKIIPYELVKKEESE